MKKCLTILLVLLMLSASACGGSKDAGTDTPEPHSADNMESDSKEDSESQDETEKYIPDASTLDEFDTSGVIEETVLIDEANVKVTANEISYDDYDCDIKLTIENNSDKDLTFIAGSIGYSANSVNGYMIKDGFFNETVTAGKKANTKVSFDYDSLRLMGINSIADIELGIYINDDDHNTLLTRNCVLKTNLSSSYDYDEDTYINSIDSKELKSLLSYDVDVFNKGTVYDKSGVQMVSEAIITNSSGEKLLACEFVNTTDKQVVVTASDFTVNGLLISSGRWSSAYINPGKRAVCTYEIFEMISENQMKIFGIDDIGTIEYNLAVLDSDRNEIEPDSPIKVSVDEDASPDLTGDELYNENGIIIISKGVADDDFSYSDDIHFYLLIQNNSGQEIMVTDSYGTASVNGFMTNDFMYTYFIPEGKCALCDIEFQSYSLEENGITNKDEIEEIEITLDDGEDYTEAQKQIFNLFSKLGITDNFERTSYLELLEKLY